VCGVGCREEGVGCGAERAGCMVTMLRVSPRRRRDELLTRLSARAAAPASHTLLLDRSRSLSDALRPAHRRMPISCRDALNCQSKAEML
jgi:hypothetical protein